MPNLLTDLQVKEVSLVDRPANAETDPLTGAKVARARVALYKSDSDAEAGQTVDGKVFPRSDFAYTPSDNVSEWKLRLTSTPGGKPDTAIVGAAAAALGPGFRGSRVEIPAAARAAVVARVRAAWRQANPDKSPDDMPEALKKGDTSMTLQEIEAKVTAQDGLIATMKADTDVHKAQTEEVLKMSDKERKAFGSMSADKRKEYMAADATKRKAMCKEFGKPEDGDEGDDGDSDGSAKKIAKVEQAFQASQQAFQVAQKADQDRIAKLEADNAQIKKSQRLEHFSAMAEAELPHTAGSRVAKGETLMTLADTLPNGETGDRFKEMLSTMKAADKLIGDKMHEIGKWGGGVSMGSKTALESKVQEIVKRDSIDEGHAWIKASEEAPELFQKYEAEQRAYKPAA